MKPTLTLDGAEDLVHYLLKGYAFKYASCLQRQAGLYAQSTHALHFNR